MWLFDDLLKKPTPPTPVSDGSSSATAGQWSGAQSGGGTPIADPLATAAQPIKIEKTEEVSIITESPVNTAAAQPEPVHVVAVDDISSILVTHTATPATASEDIVSSTLTSGVQQVQDSTISPISNVQLTDDTNAHVIHNTSEVDLWNLFWDNNSSISEVTQSEGILSWTSFASLEPTEVPEVIQSIDMSNSSPEDSTLLWIMDEESIINDSHSVEEVAIYETPISQSVKDDLDSVSAPILDLPSSSEWDQSNIESYEHPAEFIADSIARIDAMISRIDIAHGTKLEEALGYKSEKEKYTALEDQAYADAEKYVIEKEHALTMRTYFVEQWEITTNKQDTSNSSVSSIETTLTGLAVQNAVSETVKDERKTKAKKTENEAVWLLWL